MKRCGPPSFPGRRYPAASSRTSPRKPLAERRRASASSPMRCRRRAAGATSRMRSAPSPDQTIAWSKSPPPWRLGTSEPRRRARRPVRPRALPNAPQRSCARRGRCRVRASRGCAPRRRRACASCRRRRPRRAALWPRGGPRIPRKRRSACRRARPRRRASAPRLGRDRRRCRRRQARASVRRRPRRRGPRGAWSPSLRRARRPRCPARLRSRPPLARRRGRLRRSGPGGSGRTPPP